MTGLTVNPEDGGATVLGKTVSSLQNDIVLDSDEIGGTLKYVTGYTGFSSNEEEQSGNYLALKFTAPEGAVVTIELLGGTVGHPVTLDSDMNCVLRITKPKTQRLRVVMTNNGETTTRIYKLRELVLEPAE